jgi:Zn-dependent protease
MNGGATIQIGTVAGIPLRIHVSWVVVLFLVASSLSLSLAPTAGTFAPVVGLLTATAFFSALVAHELGHALVARRAGVGVSSITLFVFGGVASLDSEPQRPRDELAIAIAGPLVSVFIAVVAFALSLLALPPIVAEPLRWLARVNAGVAVFNLLPGFPLDGGRVLRGILWAVWRDPNRATATAAGVGRGIAYAMITVGVGVALFGFIGNGLWIGLVGWFLLSAARASVAPFPTIPAAASVGAYVKFVMTTGDRRPYVVIDQERSLGEITIERALRVPPELRQVVTMGDLAAETGT